MSRKHYRGYTYPRVLHNRLAQYLWRKIFCPGRIHLWDEVLGEEHYLVCDACQGEVRIVESEDP